MRSNVRSLACAALLVAACAKDLTKAGDGGSTGGADGATEDFVPSNISADLLTAGTGPIMITGGATIDTDAGTIDGALPTGVTFQSVSQGGGAPSLGVFSASSVTIAAGATVEVTGAAALVFAVSGDARIEGTIVATGGRGAPITPGPGGYTGGTPEAKNGGGPGAGPGADVPEDVGAGGAGHLAAGGGGGGRGAVGGAAGGPQAGSEALVPLRGGSGGGYGGGQDVTSGPGGGGGGAVQISARGAIVIASGGGINVGGGGGQGGVTEDGGGGGGAGGAILLEGASVSVEGTLAANGGGGGAGADGQTSGENGQPGVLGDARATGGATAGEGRAGGPGGASGEPAGGDGTAADGVDGSDNGGGGGGSAGRIRLRAAAPPSTPGTISPAEGLSTATL